MSELGWQLGLLREIAQPVGDKWIPTSTETGVPYVGLEHILPENPKIGEYGNSSKVISTKNLFETGDTLFGKLRPYLKKVALADRSGVCSTDIIPVRANKKADPLFLYYLLSSQKIIAKAVESSAGNVMPRASWSDLADIEIEIPPLPEQKKIAEILSGIDRAIDSINRATERLDLLKKSLSLQLLGAQSGQYRQSTLGDACIKIQDGTHFSPQSKDGDRIYITSKNIRPGRLDLSSVAWISTEEHNSIYKRCQVKKGDILLTKDGANTGNACLNTLDEEFSLLSSVAFLRSDPSTCEANYMLQWIMSDAFQNAIKQEMSGNAISRLTLTKINNLSISLPPLETQREIAGILQSLDNQRKSYQSKADSLSGLKNALSSDLLSGRKRVSV